MVVLYLLRYPIVKLTALFNKIKYRDPSVMPAWNVLRMATIEGGRAVGLGDEIDSLEVGKQADLILVDLKALNLSPVLEAPIRNIVPNLVYAGSGHEVKTVMVAGRILVRDGVVLAADEGAVRAEAQEHAEAVARRVAADPVHREMVLLDAMEAGQLLVPEMSHSVFDAQSISRVVCFALAGFGLRLAGSKRVGAGR